MIRRARGRAPSAAAALLTAFFATLLFALWRIVAADPATEALEARLLDQRFLLRGALPEPPGVAVLAVDEAALAEAPPGAPLRAALAEALRRLHAHRPAAVALDFLFIEATAADRDLAAALRALGRVALAAAALDGAPRAAAPAPEQEAAYARSAIGAVISTQEGPPAPPNRLLPAPRLAAAAAALGHVNIRPSPDGRLRRLRLASEDPVAPLPALPLAAVVLAAGKGASDVRLVRGDRVELDGRTWPLDLRDALAIRHAGPAGTIRTVTLSAFLAGRVPPDAFTGRIVFVGSAAPSLGDRFATPFGSSVPGAESLAAVAADLLSGPLLRRDAGTALVSILLALAACAAAFGAARLGRPGAALLAGAGAWIAAGTVLQLAFAPGNLQLDAVSVLFGLFAGSASGIALRRRELSLQRANLARYVAPALADRLARDATPHFDRREQQAAVLFADVQGFSALSERAASARTAAFLSALHERFEDTASRFGGVVTDYSGDGAMIVFGLPDPLPDDAARALACARALLTEAPALAAAAPDGEPPRLRVSLHAGPVTAAVLGGRRQSVVTVTGDTVNVAARLQETAKAVRASLAVTRAALSAAGRAPEAEGMRLLAHAPVRGRQAPVEVWGL